MNRRPHVCVVTSVHPDYDSRVYKHCLSVARLGYETTLISSWMPIRDEPFRFLSFPQTLGIRGRLKQMVAIARLALRADADIYHFHDIDLLPLMALFRMATGKAVVYDIHENYAEEMLVRYWVPKALRYPLFWAVYYGQRFCCAILRNVVGVVDTIMEDVGARWLHGIQIRNFASKDLARAATNDYDQRDPAVLFLSSQSLQYGSLLFLDIVERVLKRRRDIHFYSIDRFGFDGAFRERVMKDTEDRGLGEHVTMLPSVLPHEVMTYINRCTICIAPNLNIPQQAMGFSTKLFEYMAGGVPIVATDLPYRRRLARESGAIMLADADEPEAFVDAICRLTDNREEARRMGQAGRNAFFQRFCWESQDSKLREFYEAILSRSGRKTFLAGHDRPNETKPMPDRACGKC